MYTILKPTTTLAIAALVICCMPFTDAFAKASFSINYTDTSQEGFNDTTVVSPIANNTGTTLGSQRKIAFEYAVAQLAIILHSEVTIEIDAHFDALGGNQFSATLAQAGPNTIHFDFTDAPESNVYYVQALANKLNGSDLDSGADIDAQFNSDVDGSTVLGTDTWYYGLDASPSGLDTDFISVAMHELIHGLGFLALGNVSTGANFNGKNDIYGYHLEHRGASELSYPAMTNTQRAAANIATGDLQWGGSQTINDADAFLTAGLNTSKPQIYAPNPSESGSSVSHFSDALSPNQMMEPFYSTANHTVGIAGALLADLGWGNFTDLSVVITDSTDPVAAGDIIYLVATISNSGTRSADASYFTYTIPSELNYTSASPSQGSCADTSTTITCNIGSIGAGGSANVSFSLTTNSATGSVNHSASVYANIVDYTPSNNADTETTTVQAAGTVTSNSVPIANAGSDESVETNTSLGLNGSGSSDSDGSIVAYSWLQTGGDATVTIINADSSKPTLIAPTGSDTLIIQLTVTDNLGATALDAITITVTNTSAGSETSDQSTPSVETVSNRLSGGSGGGAFSFIGLLLLLAPLFRTYSKVRSYSHRDL